MPRWYHFAVQPGGADVKKNGRIAAAVLIMLITVLALYGIGCGLLYRGVQRYTGTAEAAYGGEAVPALMALAQDPEARYEDRNGAIWALGQIGDPRALPVLRELQTGEVQTTPYDPSACIVQYSVEKAIRQIEGFTVTKWIYRWLD
jgi:hypothetical protein